MNLCTVCVDASGAGAEGADGVPNGAGQNLAEVIVVVVVSEVAETRTGREVEANLSRFS